MHKRPGQRIRGDLLSVYFLLGWQGTGTAVDVGEEVVVEGAFGVPCGM